MRWTKSGLIIPSPPPVQWAASHAMDPLIEPVADGKLRLYFSSRDDTGRSSTGYADFDPHTPQMLEFGQRALLEPGPLGSFDDSGAMGSCIVEHDGRKHLYYIGWTRGVS